MRVEDTGEEAEKDAAELMAWNRLWQRAAEGAELAETAAALQLELLASECASGRGAGRCTERASRNIAAAWQGEGDEVS
jgi:hypothetical protein